MFLKIFLLLFITILCNDVIHAKSVRKQEVQDTSAPSNPYGVTNFDYDDLQTVPRIFSLNRYRQKSNPTTPRPLVSYWQNIMRNVRLPMPSITWNVTNPLANLFNMGDEQPIATTHNENYYSVNTQRRQKNKRRRKHSHKKRNRKNKQPVTYAEPEQANELLVEEQQMFLPTAVDPNGAMYFYDPNTDAYFAVQRVRALSSIVQPDYSTQLSSTTVDTASKQKKPEVAVNAPMSNESSNTANTPITTADENDAESDINLDDAEEIDLDKIESTQPAKNVPPKQQEKPENTALNEETLRSVLGSYMVDDQFNRQRQRSKDQRRASIGTKQKPRNNPRYYFLLNRN